MLPQKRLPLLGLGLLALFLSINPANAALTIYVSESGSDVVFSWSGIIGDSGANTAVTTITPTADYIDPKNANTQYAFSAADRSLTGVDTTGAGNWTADATYSGSTTSVYGDGAANSGGSVSGGGIPFTIADDGTLYVGTAESLATAAFSGTYTISGEILSSLGLFNTVGKEATEAAPFTFWSANSGSGLVQFVVVPEPSTSILAGLFLSLMVCVHRNRRS